MIVSYGKKPRKGKGSEIYEIEGLSFYLYNAKSTTKGITEIYYIDGNKYPLIAVAESNEKAKLWLNSSITRVRAKLLDLAMRTLVDRSEFVKTNKEENIVIKKETMPTVEELQSMHNRIINEVDI